MNYALEILKLIQEKTKGKLDFSGISYFFDGIKARIKDVDYDGQDYELTIKPLKDIRPLVDKDYYTTEELAMAPWFPVRTAATIRSLLENSRIKYLNVSTNPKVKRYRIPKEEVIRFLAECDDLGYFGDMTKK